MVISVPGEYVGPSAVQSGLDLIWGSKRITIARAGGILYLWLFSFALHTVVASASSGGDFVRTRTRVFIVYGFSERASYDHILATVSKSETFFMGFVVVKRRRCLIWSGRGTLGHAKVRKRILFGKVVLGSVAKGSGAVGDFEGYVIKRSISDVK